MWNRVAFKGFLSDAQLKIPSILLFIKIICFFAN